MMSLPVGCWSHVLPGGLSLVPCSFWGVSVAGPMFLLGFSLTETPSPRQSPPPLDRDPLPSTEIPSPRQRPPYSKEGVHILLNAFLLLYMPCCCCEIFKGSGIPEAMANRKLQSTSLQ